mmetsp:Transcript_916/g.2391  ORF Transcript_916/g.2391 Transcript_916/m.2391 type:complete len:230 (+) Transcript_916:599-1288(+)
MSSVFTSRTCKNSRRRSMCSAAAMPGACCKKDSTRADTTGARLFRPTLTRALTLFTSCSLRTSSAPYRRGPVNRSRFAVSSNCSMASWTDFTETFASYSAAGTRSGAGVSPTCAKSHSNPALIDSVQASWLYSFTHFVVASRSASRSGLFARVRWVRSARAIKNSRQSTSTRSGRAVSRSSRNILSNAVWSGRENSFRIFCSCSVSGRRARSTSLTSVFAYSVMGMGVA